MNERSYWREWPLAVFTVALQFACASAAAAAVLEWRGNRMLAGDLASIVLEAAVVAISVSLLHLGRPHRAWQALTNLRHSRLSQEIWAVGAFMVCATVYEAVTYRNVTALRLLCSSVTAAAGIIAVVANAGVYNIPTQPHWRKAWAVVSAFAVVLIAAVLLPIFYSR